MSGREFWPAQAVHSLYTGRTQAGCFDGLTDGYFCGLMAAASGGDIFGQMKRERALRPGTRV